VGVDDAYVASELARAKTYTVVYLKAGPRYEDHPDRDALTYDHVKRNFDLKLSGDIAVVGPTRTDGDVRGLYIFNRSLDEASQLIAADPAVEAGIFVYEAQELMAFPGDTLA
jgi:uncharacterized protein YciI